MRFKRIDALFLLAVIAGLIYFVASRMGFHDIRSVPLKTACVALLAVWAAAQARSLDGWLIAGVMALGAVGDVLIEFKLEWGAIGFLIGHVVAVWLYRRNRRGNVWIAVVVALVVALAAWELPLIRSMAPGIAFYALGLGAMAGMALVSRFARDNVGIGALMFVASDLLIFSRLGPLHDSVLPGLLIWPLYVAGQAAIAWGVVTTLRAERP